MGMNGNLQIWKSKKIRKVSLDTDVISDILYREALLTREKTSILEHFKLQRSEISFKILNLLFGVKVQLVGSVVVKEELCKKSKYLVKLFEKTFDITTQLNKKIKNLAKKYEEKLVTKPADALILADLSFHEVDCFMSWNRKHIVNPKNYAAMSKINRYSSVPTPMLLTPAEFLERVGLEPRTNVIWISRQPVPRKFFPRFYPSKQLP